jgi:hypothetical protein
MNHESFPYVASGQAWVAVDGGAGFSAVSPVDDHLRVVHSPGTGHVRTFAVEKRWGDIYFALTALSPDGSTYVVANESRSESIRGVIHKLTAP